MPKVANPGCGCCVAANNVTGHVYSCTPGGPVSGSTVTLKQGTTTVGTATTDATGSYTIPFTAGGNYTVSATRPYTLDPDSTGLLTTAGMTLVANGTTQTAPNLIMGAPSGQFCCNNPARILLPKTLHVTTTIGTALTLAFNSSGRVYVACDSTTATARSTDINGRCTDPASATVPIGYSFSCAGGDQYTLTQWVGSCDGVLPSGQGVTCNPGGFDASSGPLGGTVGAALKRPSVTAAATSISPLSVTFTFTSAGGSLFPGSATVSE
jgi:hypothetical protein